MRVRDPCFRCGGPVGKIGTRISTGGYWLCRKCDPMGRANETYPPVPMVHRCECGDPVVACETLLVEWNTSEYEEEVVRARIFDARPDRGGRYCLSYDRPNGKVVGRPVANERQWPRFSSHVCGGRGRLFWNGEFSSKIPRGCNET